MTTMEEVEARFEAKRKIDARAFERYQAKLSPLYTPEMNEELRRLDSEIQGLLRKQVEEFRQGLVQGDEEVRRRRDALPLH